MATDMKPFHDGNFFLDRDIWKYFSIERFLFLLQHKALYFAAANQFADSFEGATHISKQIENISVGEIINLQLNKEESDLFHQQVNRAFKELGRLTKVNCWHLSDFENGAMWALYAQQGRGIAIVSTPGSILSSITDHLFQSNYGTETIHFGPVKYIDLSEKRYSFSMLDRLFYKHSYFQWENEFRFLVSLRLAEEFGVTVPEQGILVDIEPKAMMKSVFLGPSITDEEEASILALLAEHGLEHLVVHSSALCRPIFI